MLLRNCFLFYLRHVQFHCSVHTAFCVKCSNDISPRCSTVISAQSTHFYHKMLLQTVYTGCPRRNVPDFGRVFLKLRYTDITQNTYIQSWTVTEIMAWEKWGLLAVPNTATCTADSHMTMLASLRVNAVFTVPAWRFAQSAMLRHRWAFSCIVLVTLRTNMTWVRVFL